MNLIAYTHAESGVGELGRLIFRMLQVAQVPTSLFSCAAAPSRQSQRFAGTATRRPFDRNLICATAEEIPKIYDILEGTVLSALPTIGYWPWEVDLFPEAMAASASKLTEVWTLSTHAATAISQSVDIPVLVIPPYVETPSAQAAAHQHARRDRPSFLFCFDMFSVFERKNPLAVVEAFVRAFPSADTASLLIKVINGAHSPHQLATLIAAASDRPDIIIRDGYLGAREQAALVASCDCYVSLHRAEGFGFTMAEAMALSKPVIATGYSGNADFMDQSNSFLVPYTLVPVGEGHAPYPETANWADPDIDQAAQAMRVVVADPERALETGRQARSDIATKHGLGRCAAQVAERLGADPPPSVPVLPTRLQAIASAEIARSRLGGPRLRRMASPLVRQGRRAVRRLRNVDSR